MPVLGHAFVGLATAKCTRPTKIVSAGAALWTPVLVGLAYLPDIVNAVFVTLGLGDRQIVTHSLFFAVAASVLIGPALAWLVRCSLLKAWLLTLFSVSFHVVLDILQGSNRQPWWPFSDHHIKLKDAIIPLGMYREVLLFGIPFAVFWVCHSLIVWRLSLRRGRRGHPAPARSGAAAQGDSQGSLPAYEEFPVPQMTVPRPGAATRPARSRDERCSPYGRLVWVGRIVTAMILLSAGALHYLKGVRNREMEAAFKLVRQHDYARALAATEVAERWPYVAAPGRLEYVKALCYEGLGRRDEAEAWFLASIKADPSYYWALADLVEFYASGKEPRAERRRRAEPYLHRLKTQFTGYYSRPQFIEQIERMLAEPPPPRKPPPKRKR
jgi:membrane-bound metal-dependent hydrolase YbcI (DUF457 family)